GYHVVTYVMGIFLLNRLIDFLSPKIVPETSTDEVLPTKSSEEFRPFLRKLPELKFWYDDFFVDCSLTGTHVPYVYLYLYSVHFCELSRCTCVLADLSDVLLFAVLRDYEASNIAYDQIPLLTIHLWETTSSVQWNEILK
ncbi:uncharacterized protein DC041_0000964, partial [Schistosoma bovis]